VPGSPFNSRSSALESEQLSHVIFYVHQVGRREHLVPVLGDENQMGVQEEDTRAS
jgi:hypothetical protein